MKKNRVFRLAYIGIPLILALVILSCAPVQRYPIGQDIANQSFSKGLEFGRQWRLEEAKEQFEKASKADPSGTRYVLAKAWLGVIEDFVAQKIERKAVEYIMTGKASLAIVEYDKVIEKNPRWAGAYKNRGLLLFLSDKRRAMADFDKALELNPSDDIIYALKGDAIFELKQDCGQAIADYGKALELNPRNLRALNGKAWHLATCSDTKYRDGVKAIELAQKAVELCPIAVYFDTLAAAYAEAGRFEDAITTQEKAIALARKEGYAPNRIAQYTLRLSSYSSHAEGGFKEAKEGFEKALRNLWNPYLDEDTKEVLRGIEDLDDLKAARHCLKGFDHLFRTARDAKAIREFDKAIEINPKFAIAYYGRGTVYDMQQQDDQAIAEFNKAIEINPQFALAYHFRGTIYHERRQYDQAISDYNKAIDINPQFVRAYLYRGFFYEATRQYGKAVSDYTKAIEINPRYTEAYNSRGLVMWKLGNTKKACSDFKRACELGGGSCYYGNCE